MLFYVDAGQRFRFHNRAYREWLGLRDVQVDGQLLTDVIGPGVYAEIQDKVVKALSGEQVSFEHPQTMPSGAIYRLNIAYLPHFDALGKVIGFFGLMNDITEREHVAALAAAAGESDSTAERDLGGRPLIVTDASGQTLYLNSMTEQLTGWSNPEARLRQASATSSRTPSPSPRSRRSAA